MIEDPRTTIIDMLPDGSFREPPRRGWSVRAPLWLGIAIAGSAVVVSIVIVLWLAVTVLPLVAAGLLIALLVTRFRMVHRRLRPVPARWRR